MKTDISYNEFDCRGTGPEIFEHFYNLREDLAHAELERDTMLSLLHEVVEASDADDINEIVERIKEFTVNRPCPLPY